MQSLVLLQAVSNGRLEKPQAKMQRRQEEEEEIKGHELETLCRIVLQVACLVLLPPRVDYFFDKVVKWHHEQLRNEGEAGKVYPSLIADSYSRTTDTWIIVWSRNV